MNLLAAIYNVKEFAINIGKKNQTWCLDSGCTSLMCSDEKRFSDLNANQNNILNLTTTTYTNVKGIRDIKAIFKNDEIHQAANLHNFFHFICFKFKKFIFCSQNCRSKYDSNFSR